MTKAEFIQQCVIASLRSGCSYNVIPQLIIEARKAWGESQRG